MKAITIVVGTVFALLGLIVMISYGPDSVHPMKDNMIYGGVAVVCGILTVVRAG